jgi:hypothetical protein
MKAEDKEYRRVKVLRGPYSQRMSKNVYSEHAAHNSVVPPPANIIMHSR